MGTGTALLLERQRIFRSRDAEETRAFLRGKEFRFDVMPRDARRLDVHINGVYLPGMGVVQSKVTHEIPTDGGRPILARHFSRRDDEHESIRWCGSEAARR